MKLVKVVTLSAVILISACSMRSDFEELAYQLCIKDGKYPDKVCACNAKNLNQMLTEEEKSNFKKAALGDLTASMEMLDIIRKLQEALLKCA